MKTFSKAVAGTFVAGAMVASAMSPAMAQDRRHNDGIRTGEVIAGALIVGGIVALASQGRNDRRYHNVNPRQAVERCVRAAEQGARRMNGKVTDVRAVRETRNGYQVQGRIAVKTFQGQWRGRGQHGNGWGNDMRGWNNNLRGYDAGTFVCNFQNGRTNVDYRGIRGL
jgi:hypothetical protein